MAVQQQSAANPSHVVVVGAGWGGWGAAKALCEAGVRVTLVDGLADPTGSTPLAAVLLVQGLSPGAVLALLQFE